MNLAALTKRLEALEEQRKATEKKPWVAVKRIWDDGKLISERIWQDGKEITGCNGLGILRQCLETQKLEELGDRLNRLEGIDHGANRSRPAEAPYRH